MAIRYDKALNKEINRVIRNFNAKVKRLERKNIENIPSLVTKKGLKSTSYRRRDLYRKLENLRAFSKRGSEDIISLNNKIKISRYDYELLKKESANAKRNLTRQIKRYRESYPKVFGKLQDVTFAQTGDSAYLSALEKRESLNRDLTKMSLKSFMRYVGRVKRESIESIERETVFKDRYLNMLTNLGYQTEYDKTKLEEIKERIRKLEGDKFYKLFREDKAIQQIVEYYESASDLNGEIDFEDIRDDVAILYDNIYDNLDLILKDYA